MLNVKHKFKKLKERVVGSVTGSPDSKSMRGTVQERRNEALVRFGQAFATVLIALWLAPLFPGLENLIMVAAGLIAVPFVIQGLILSFTPDPSAERTKAKTSPSPAAKSPKIDKPSPPAPQTPKINKSPTPAANGDRRQNTAGLSFRDLQQKGWKITCNLSLPNLGDVDVFLQSPNKHYFVINIQSQWGEVFFDEGVLKLRQGASVSNFENDLLGHVTEQALAVKKMKRLRNVTPILCFNEANVSIETVNNKARDVYVVKKDSLVRKLVKLDNG
jgi:hypothetical protein